MGGTDYRFQIDGQTYYGWVRLNVKANRSGKDIGGLLTGYAYQTQPNVPILAGATVGEDAVGESSPKPADDIRPMTLGVLALGSVQ